MGLFNRKKPKEDEVDNGKLYGDIAKKLHQIEEDGKMNKSEDGIIYLTTAKNTGNTVIMGSGKNLTKALVRAMHEDSDILALLEQAISIHKAMDSIGSSGSIPLGKSGQGMPPGLMDKLKDLMSRSDLSTHIVDATDPNNPREVSLDEFKRDMENSSEGGSMIDDLLKDSGIKRKDPKEFDDDLESLGE